MTMTQLQNLALVLYMGAGILRFHKYLNWAIKECKQENPDKSYFIAVIWSYLTAAFLWPILDDRKPIKDWHLYLTLAVTILVLIPYLK